MPILTSVVNVLFFRQFHQFDICCLPGSLNLGLSSEELVRISLTSLQSHWRAFPKTSPNQNFKSKV